MFAFLFNVYYDACIEGFGVALEQEQPDDSVWPIAYISRATLDSERHWTPLDLEAGSIVWAIKRLRGYLWGTKFPIFSDHKALESIGKVRDHNARVQRWLEFFTAFVYTLEYRKGNANGNADFLSRLPEPATEH
ncbi:MAG: ribonuclease H family protein, partial [Marinobacter sp.]